MSKLAVIKESIFKMESNFQEIIQQNGLDLNWKKESSFAIQSIVNNEMLQSCSEGSLVTAVFNVALTGLTLNPKLAYCYLVPRGGKAVLDVSYQGLNFLMTNTLDISRIHSDVIYKNDEFDYYTDEGGTKIKHRPNKFGDRGAFLGSYAVAYLNGGGCVAVVLNESEINDIKAVSKSASSPYSPWSKFFGEMCKKTAVRRLWKMIPKTERVEQISNAISIDDDNLDADFSGRRNAQPKTETPKASDLFKEEPKEETPQQEGEAQIVDAEIVSEEESADKDEADRNATVE